MTSIVAVVRLISILPPTSPPTLATSNTAPAVALSLAQSGARRLRGFSGGAGGTTGGDCRYAVAVMQHSIGRDRGLHHLTDTYYVS
ncbi:hypothetical protein Ait01nite_050400 [Actinoplanes italicus]|nr:hypothetical protein Ait01nite_050400 [Actinoplanes italicus]